MKNATAHDLTVPVGTELRNFDIHNATGEDIDAVKKLVARRGVVMFPFQKNLTVENHIAFGRKFGELEGPHPTLTTTHKREHQEIFELRARGDGPDSTPMTRAAPAANEWHADMTFKPSPNKYSILHMRGSADIGGETMWASTEAAFAALSPAMQDFLSKLTALHDGTPHNKPEVNCIHPVVRVHPETGVKSLYVSEHFTRRIVELTAFESKAVLEFLAAHLKLPRFHCRYRWPPTTPTTSHVVIWDNRNTQHSVVETWEGKERFIQRVAVAGDIPRGVGSVDLTKAENCRYPHQGRSSGGALARHDRQLYDTMKRLGRVDSREDAGWGIAGGKSKL